MLSHLLDDNTERPVAFVSRTLSPTELKYSQLDKEALSIIFGVRHFHQYLYGRKFLIMSDHKPLRYILGETRGIPPMASARIQRWALMLSAYNYVIHYKPGSENANADGLSRLPMSNSLTEVPLPGDVLLLFRTLESTPVGAKQIRQWTDVDPVLLRVRRYLLSGWVDSKEPELQPYQSRSLELSIQDGCVLWGSRIIVPQKGREAVISLLHEGHPGVTRMKRLARLYVWWPRINKDLEFAVKTCGNCQEHQKAPSQAPMHPWEWPDRPWTRIHLDYAGPIQNKMILVVVDSHSKWIEAHVVNSATSQVTIERLQGIFATHGLPETIVWDNGSVFTSEEFSAFVRSNGIRHLTSAPYHPASNGLAERAVQTLKNAIKKDSGGVSLQTQLNNFLFRYRITPHSTTGIVLAELTLGRRPKSHLDFLFPDVADRVRKKQAAQKAEHDHRAHQRNFSVGQAVWVKNLPNFSTWVPGVITLVLGLQRFRVALEDGRVFDRHIDHIRSRTPTPETPAQSTPTGDTIPIPDLTDDDSTNVSPSNLPAQPPDPPAPPVVRSNSSDQPQPPPCRSTRGSRPPDRFM